MTITAIEGISIPDTKLASEVKELVRDTESPLLFNHSSRVYYFSALAGMHRGLHTAPSIPQHMHPVIALLTAGVEMDVLGIAYAKYSNIEREAVVQAHARTAHFKEDIIQAFYNGIKHKPDTTFGNVKPDVLADNDPSFRRINFCSVIRESPWPA